MKEIHRKHLKSIIFIDEFSTETKFVSKLVVCKFINGFF